MRKFFVLVAALFCAVSGHTAAGDAGDVLTRENAMWVHYTRYKPRGTHLISGSVPVQDLGPNPTDAALEKRLELVQAAPQPRATLHGVLNGGVASHNYSDLTGKEMRIDRSGYAYAVMKPFSALENVLDAYPQDAYVLGPVSLAGTQIFVAHGADRPDVDGAEIIDVPADQKMFDAVKAHLIANGLPVIDFDYADQTVKITSQKVFDYYLVQTMTERRASMLNGLTLAVVQEKIATGLASRMIQSKFPYHVPHDQARLRINGGPLKELSDVMPWFAAHYNCWTHTGSALCDLEKAVQNSTLLMAVRQFVTMPELQSENNQIIRTVSSRINLGQISEERTMLRSAIKAAKADVTARHKRGDLTDAGVDFFNTVTSELNVWVKYILGAEIKLRKEGKTLFRLTAPEGEDTFSKRVDRVAKTVQKMRNDRAAPAAAGAAAAATAGEGAAAAAAAGEGAAAAGI